MTAWPWPAHGPRCVRATRFAIVFAAWSALAPWSMAEAAAPAGEKPVEPTYILRGFRLSGAKGVDQDALTDSLKQKPGDKITGADIDADTKAIGAALKARHIEGRLFATVAEKDGRAWVLFDFQPAELPPKRVFVEQSFEGNSKVSDKVLAAATGLKPGDEASDARLNRAEQAMEAAYTQKAPGVRIHIGGRLRTTKTHQLTVHWVITEHPP